MVCTLTVTCQDKWTACVVVMKIVLERSLHILISKIQDIIAALCVTKIGKDVSFSVTWRVNIAATVEGAGHISHHKFGILLSA